MEDCEFRQIRIRRDDGIIVETLTTGGKREIYQADSVYLDGFKIRLFGTRGFAIRGGFDGEAPFDAVVETDDLHGTEAVWIEREQ